MDYKNLFLVALLGLLSGSVFGQEQGSQSCESLFSAASIKTISQSKSPRTRITDTELLEHLSIKIDEVPEFSYIRSLAEDLGIRVWLFGGTASSFLHYVKWDLATSEGLIDFQKDRFNYDFTNIFRSTQDIDVVVDASPQVASEFQRVIVRRFPHFLGYKENHWEVRTLRQRIGSPGFFGYKEALLDDADFFNQNTDSNSIGMVEITRSNGEPIVRDLRNWDKKKSLFLHDALRNQISFLRSDRHFETSRAKNNENPEILSVLRILVKAFQYDLKIPQSDFEQIRFISEQFDPSRIRNGTASRRIEDTARKLIMHAVDIERAMNVLDELGLRQKLISMSHPEYRESAGWWLMREPLRSKPVGAQGIGKTARELGIEIVAHETHSFSAMESITRSHLGEPNVFISRSFVPDESASFGNGFYTVVGRVSFRGTGITIRFEVNPAAREGEDFLIVGPMVIFINKKALRVIPESLSYGWDEILQLGEMNEHLQVHYSDTGLLEKQRRRFTTARIMNDLHELLISQDSQDFERLLRILKVLQSPKISQLVSDEVRRVVIQNFYLEILSMADSKEPQDLDRFLRMKDTMKVALEALQLIQS